MHPVLLAVLIICSQDTQTFSMAANGGKPFGQCVFLEVGVEVSGPLGQDNVPVADPI